LKTASVVRVVRDRLLERAARRRGPAPVGGDGGEVQPRLDEAGIELERSGILALGIRQSIHGAQAVGAIERRNGVARIEGEGARIERGGLSVALLGLGVLCRGEERVRSLPRDPSRGRPSAPRRRRPRRSSDRRHIPRPG
jgi:hypothetical protein